MVRSYSGAPNDAWSDELHDSGHLPQPAHAGAQLVSKQPKKASRSVTPAG